MTNTRSSVDDFLAVVKQASTKAVKSAPAVEAEVMLAA